MPAPNTNYSDSFAATAIERWARDVLYDQIFEKTPVLAWLKQHQDPAPDGLKVVEPLQYAQSSTAGAFAKGATFTVTDREIATNAEYDWVYYGDAIAIYPQDLMKCAGESQKVNLLKAKMQNVELSLSDAINADIWASSQATSAFIPLPVMIDATSTIGGINSTTYSWWQSQTDTDSVALSTVDLASTYNSCSNGKAGIAPTLLVMTQTLFEGFEELVLPYYRIQDTKMGKLGFDALRYKNAEVVWDENCTSGCVYFLNDRVLKWRPHTQCATRFLVQEGNPSDQLARARIVWTMFTLTCARRSALGKHTNKTQP